MWPISSQLVFVVVLLFSNVNMGRETHFALWNLDPRDK